MRLLDCSDTGSQAGEWNAYVPDVIWRGYMSVTYRLQRVERAVTYVPDVWRGFVRVSVAGFVRVRG